MLKKSKWPPDIYQDFFSLTGITRSLSLCYLFFLIDWCILNLIYIYYSDIIVTHKTDVYPIEIGNKHGAEHRPREKETLKTTHLMSVSEEASNVTTCISVSESARLKKKTVCTVKGIVTKVADKALLTNLDITVWSFLL